MWILREDGLAGVKYILLETTNIYENSSYNVMLNNKNLVIVPNFVPLLGTHIFVTSDKINQRNDT